MFAFCLKVNAVLLFVYFTIPITFYLQHGWCKWCRYCRSGLNAPFLLRLLRQLIECSDRYWLTFVVIELLLCCTWKHNPEILIDSNHTLQGFLHIYIVKLFDCHYEWNVCQVSLAIILSVSTDLLQRTTYRHSSCLNSTYFI